MPYRKKIVIVDDNQVNLLLLREFLNIEFDVKTFSTPFKALDFIKRYHTDLIVSDLMMPEMDGIQLLNEVNKFQDTPFIILSANNDEKNIRKAMTCGARAYLLKPVHFNKLINTINSSIKKNKNKCYENQ